MATTARPHAPLYKDTAHPAVTSPLDAQTEVEANMPIATPATKSCTETLMNNHPFENSYGAPFVGGYTPTSCAAPWSLIVLTFSSNVAGDQFDRTVDVTIGGTEIFLGTTSEPCCTGNAVSWSMQQDVTDYAPIFTTPQPVVVELDNVNTSTYTGIYDSSLIVTFYETGTASPAASAPDAVYGLTPQATTPVASGSFAGTLYGLSTPDQLAGRKVTFPRNLVRLEADLWAQGQGPCEEFWWSEPTDCGVGTPYREVAIYINGILAGAAPVYPTTFTGADGPGLWEPIPSPRAWDLRPYRVDLTPFVGLLTDGQPHLVQIGMTDAAYTSGDFWNVDADLLAWTQSYSPVTVGDLTAVGTPAFTETPQVDPSGQNVEATDSVSSSRTWTGWILGAKGQKINDTVTEKVTMSSDQAGAVDDRWTWDRDSAVSDGRQTTDDTSAADFSIVDGSLAHFEFTDDDAHSTLINGSSTETDRVQETMTTTDASGLAFNGAESESYGYADTAGACYDRSIATAAGQVVADEDPPKCPSTSPVAALSPGNSTPYGPGAGVPEAPAAVMLVLGGSGVAGLLILRRRRVRRQLIVF